jgi:hypothetical protein
MTDSAAEHSDREEEENDDDTTVEVEQTPHPKSKR